MASQSIYYERTWIRLFCKCGRSKQQNATIAVTFAALLDLTFFTAYYWIVSFTALLLKSFLYTFIIRELFNRLVIEELLLPPYYWRASVTTLLLKSFCNHLIIEELLLPPYYWRASVTTLLLKNFFYCLIIEELL